MTQYNDINTLASRLKNLEERMSVAEGAPRLSYSSIQNGGITEYDAFGNPVARYGTQWDGTHTAASLSGPTPPAPTGLSVNAVVGGLEVIWAGTFEGLVPVPMDYSRVEIHVGFGSDFDITPNNLITTIESPQGGVQFITLAAGTTYFVRLATRSQSGKISAGSAAVSGVPLAPAGEAVIAIPDEPTITSIDSQWEYSAQYMPRAAFTVNFAGVTVDTAGSALDIVGYELWMKKTSEADSLWQFAATTALSSFNITGLELGTSYSFKVRALSAVAAGGFSNVMSKSFATSGVVETVPTPSTPVVSSSLSLLNISYSKTTSTGAAMPPNVARVDIYISSDGVTYTPVVASILQTGQVALDVFNLGTNARVKLKAVSFFGVESAFSAVQSATIIGVVTGDIADLSISAGKIATNAITAGKILAGAIDGMIITGAVLRTAPSGQRVHIDTTGLKAYNNLEQVVTSISASDGTLTSVGGTFTGQITATSGAISGDLLFSGGGGIRGNSTISGTTYSIAMNVNGVSMTKNDPIYGLLPMAAITPYGFSGQDINLSNLTPQVSGNTSTTRMYNGSAFEMLNTNTVNAPGKAVAQLYSFPAKSMDSWEQPEFYMAHERYSGVGSTTVVASRSLLVSTTGIKNTTFGTVSNYPPAEFVVSTNGTLRIKGNDLGVHISSGIGPTVISKSASDTGDLEVRNNLRIEGTSNFLGAITAPGGLGGLPTPTADSAAATKAYVDGLIGGTFEKVRATSTTVPTISSTNHALQADDILIGGGTIFRRAGGSLGQISIPGGISNLPAPLNGGDAVSRTYVDNVLNTGPKGLVGIANRTTVLTGITATAVSVVNVFVTGPAGRRLKISFAGITYSSDANGVVVASIRYGGTQLAQFPNYTNSGEAAATSMTQTGFTVVESVNGSANYAVYLARAVGTNPITAAGSTIDPWQIIVEDIGPV